jgi:hypothetical protein
MKKFQLRDKETKELICVCDSSQKADFVKHCIEFSMPNKTIEILDCSICL